MFDEMVKRLEARGWICMSRIDGFTYFKNGWWCRLDGPSNTIDFWRTHILYKRG